MNSNLIHPALIASCSSFRKYRVGAYFQYHLAVRQYRGTWGQTWFAVSARGTWGQTRGPGVRRGDLGSDVVCGFRRCRVAGDLGSDVVCGFGGPGVRRGLRFPQRGTWGQTRGTWGQTWFAVSADAESRGTWGQTWFAVSAEGDLGSDVVCGFRRCRVVPELLLKAAEPAGDLVALRQPTGEPPRQVGDAVWPRHAQQGRQRRIGCARVTPRR